MSRNLKVLGLALMAAFALSAVVASAASAQGKLTSDGPVKLTAAETGVGQNFLKAFSLSVQCPGSTYTGTKAGSTSELITSGSTTATLTPVYKQGNHNCTVTPGNFIATIDMNGCDYVVHIGATTGGVAGTYGVTFDVVCSGSNEITVTVWTNSTDHTNSTTPMCIMHVKAQAGLAGAHATDTGGGVIDITGTVKNIHVQKTNPGTHPVLCPTQTTATGEFSIDASVTGENAGGGATTVSLSD